MLNRLILFCTFAIFMLAVGGVGTPLQAHCKGQHSPPHEHCNVEPPPPKNSLYNVFIDGGINRDYSGSNLPGEGWKWIWDGKQVGSTYAQTRKFPLGMTYIQTEVGEDCFDPVVLMGGFFRKAKKSTANGMLWFSGTTRDGEDDVLYLLKIDGYFGGGPDGGFPGNDKIMYMRDWELKVERQGDEVAGRSCEWSGEFPDVVPVTFFIAE